MQPPPPPPPPPPPAAAARLWCRLSCRWKRRWLEECREFCALPPREALREFPRGLAEFLPRGECLCDLTLPSSECRAPPSSSAYVNSKAWRPALSNVRKHPFGVHLHSCILFSSLGRPHVLKEDATRTRTEPIYVYTCTFPRYFVGAEDVYSICTGRVGVSGDADARKGAQSALFGWR